MTRLQNSQIAFAISHHFLQDIYAHCLRLTCIHNRCCVTIVTYLSCMELFMPLDWITSVSNQLSTNC